MHREFSPAGLPPTAEATRRTGALSRRLVAWQKRVLFREEDWRIEGSVSAADLATVVDAVTDDGLPLLMTLPKLPFNGNFVGRIRDGRIAVKHRTHPALWLIGPGSYYFSGRIAENGAGVTVSGAYRLRPTLAWMYYAYFAIGAAFLAVSVIAVVLGAMLWAFVAAADYFVLRSGIEMVLVSVGYLALGWVHISFEKWLDARNRRAVRRLLDEAAAGRGAPPPWPHDNGRPVSPP